jgi:O-antigen/teichoic acid export membrane protein
MSFQKNIITQYVAQIANVVSVFLCSVLLAKSLGSNGKGSLDLYVTMYSFGVIVVGFGMSQAVANFIASNQLDKNKIISTLILCSFLGAFIFFIGMFLLQYYSFEKSFFSTAMHSFSWKVLLSIQVLFLLLNTMFTAVLFGENKFKKAAIVTVIASLLLLVFYTIIYFSVSKNNQLLFFVIAGLSVLIIQSVINLYFIFRLKAGYSFIYLYKMRELKPLWVFSSWIFITNTIQFLSYKMDVWFLQYYHQNTSIIGVYTLAVSLAQMVWLLPKVYSDILTTESAIDNTIVAKVKSSAHKMLLVSLFQGVIGFILSIFLVPILFGSDFNNTYSYIYILLLGIIPMSGAMCLSAYFAGIKRIDINFTGTLIGFLVCLVLDIVLIPTYAALGACWATVASYCVTSGYYYWRFYTMYNYK